MSSQSMDSVGIVHGQCLDCSLSPWTMSTESMDIVQSGWSHCANILGLWGKILVQDRVMGYFGLWATSS